MSAMVEKVSSNQVKIAFELEAERFESAVQQTYLRQRGRLNVPGFRRGKAPRKVIETMYGQGVFYNDALDLVFWEIYPAAVEENGLFPVGQPEVDMSEQIEPGKPVKLTATVYVRPEVTLGEYKGLGIPRGDSTVDEDAIDQEIQRLQDRNAREMEIEDRPIQDDDIVTLDYAGTVDGVPFDGGTADGATLTIGSGQFIPGFEEQMVGMSIGEEADLSVTFPEEYHNDELSGKPAVFHVRVKAIKRRELPELDDDFAQDVSEFNTLAEFRASLRENLEKQAREKADDEWEAALIETAAQSAQIDLPPPMVDSEVRMQMRILESNLQSSRLDLDLYLTYIRQTREELEASFAEKAVKYLRESLTLEAIAKAEGLVYDPEADHDAYEAELEKLATREGKAVDDYRAERSQRQLEAIGDHLRLRKVIELLKQEAA
jgi:trigger factor